MCQFVIKFIIHFFCRRISGVCVVRFYWTEGSEGVNLRMKITALDERFKDQDISQKIPLKIFYEGRSGEMLCRKHCWMENNLRYYSHEIGYQLEIYGEREVTVQMPKIFKFDFLGGKQCRFERMCELDDIVNEALIKQD